MIGIVIGIIIIFCRSGYCIAWNTPIDISATNVFSSILAALFTGTSTILAIRTIRQQNIQSIEQNFSNKLQRLNTIKSEFKCSANIITNATRIECVTLDGSRAFELLYHQFYYLWKAETGMEYNWDHDFDDYECSLDSITDVDWHESPEWCIARQNENIEKLKTCYVLYDYKKQGQVTISWEEAYKMILGRWNSQLMKYYRYLLCTLNFIDKQCTNWNISNDIKVDYLNEFVANMSPAEQALLFYFFASHKDIATLENNKNILFQNVPYLLSAEHKKLVLE